jgi:hypothetical protein
MIRDPSETFVQTATPQDLATIDQHRREVKKALRDAGAPNNLLSAIETRALRSGRRQTGQFKSNREPRWQLNHNDPQYGTEWDCKVIQLRLMGMCLQFDNAPAVPDEIRQLLEEDYVGQPIIAGSYRDSLLLESMDYLLLVREAENPRHGSSQFHIGHEDPTIHPKHVPHNISWRSHRSNLIQGNMTLREARIYIIKLIARYFELGELDIN